MNSTQDLSTDMVMGEAVPLDTPQPRLTGEGRNRTITTKCWRITQVPSSWCKNDLLNSLQKVESLEGLSACVDQLTLHPACFGSTQIALLNLRELPELFRDIGPSESKLVQVPDTISGDHYLWVDSHFHGFTPLNTPEGDIIADVVAVTGLGGHAFGSWKDRETGRMWLHDLLPQDVKGIRILTYGYNTNLETPTSNDTFLDHSRRFIENLQVARSLAKEKDRSIIFIGHSFGGILILKSLSRSRMGNQKEIFDSTRALLLFGTPHAGFDVSQLAAMVEDSPCQQGSKVEMLNLIQHLSPDSEFMATHREEMIYVLPEVRRVISFYETENTPTIKKSDTGKYQRNGKRARIVDTVSNLLNLSNEYRIPVQLDHTTMVKFTNQPHSPYWSVIKHVRESLDDITGMHDYHTEEPARKRLKNENISSIKGEVQLTFDIPFELDHKWLRNPRFTGREVFFDKLEAELKNKGPSMKIVVLFGTGGVGKTEIALEYVYKYHEDYTSVFWVNGTSEETTNLGFRAIAQRLVEYYATKRTTSEPDYLQIAQFLGTTGIVDSGGKLSTNTETIKSAVKRWYNLKENSNWLLVLDNIDDLESFPISSFIPSCSHGTIIMTSRRPECADFGTGTGIAVEEMLEKEGIELFIKCARLDKISPEDKIMVSEIAKKLGYFPLAIYQAGAYIANRKLPLVRYLKMYENRFSTIFGRASAKGPAWRYREDTVFTTWEISFRTIEKEHKDASELLMLCSFLSNEEIWDDMLRLGMGMEDDDERLDESLQKLFSYSLASRKGYSRSFYIHPLVHRWARELLSHGEIIEKVKSAVTLVSRSIQSNNEKESPGYLQFGMKVMAHIEKVVGNTQKYLYSIHEQQGSGEISGELIGSLEQLGWTCSNYERLKNSEWLLLKVLAGRERLLGMEHPDTLKAMANLAATYYRQGRLKDSEELKLKVLAGRERLLGMEHPDTLEAMANLAATYHEQGRLKDSEELELKVLAGRERLLGMEHPDTLKAMANLAVTYHEQGRLKDSEELKLKVLAGRERLLGMEHPDTLTAMANLAATYHKQGRLKDSEELDLKVLAGRERLLGMEHPDTLEAMANLAATYHKQGRLKDSEELDLKVLAGRERLLGMEHPDTLEAMANLAATYHEQGRLKDSEELELKVLAGRERLLGMEHPDTLKAMADLAATYYRQGRLKDSEELKLKVLAGRERLLGMEHPDTLEAMANLAVTYHKQGRLKDSEELDLKVLAGNERLLGMEHPHTLTAMANLAMTYREQERFKDAEELEIRVRGVGERPVENET